MKTWVCTYRYNGRDYGFQVIAETEAEARERIKQMALGRVDGELIEEISARVPGSYYWMRFKLWLHMIRGKRA